MASGVGGFLKAQTGPLPNWAWLIVIGGGIAVAYVIPKFFGQGGTSSQTGTDQGAGTSGLGLAIDPTTGLPYAVEGLVPSGGTYNGFQNPPPPPPPTNSQHQPGTFFSGPTGVSHWVSTGNLTLRQIASLYGYHTWNAIYAIPDNQKLFGAMDSEHAANYVPPVGMVITVPNIPQGQGGGTSLAPQEFQTLWPGSGTKQIRMTAQDNLRGY